jgi:hypothetical protein
MHGDSYLECLIGLIEISANDFRARRTFTCFEACRQFGIERDRLDSLLDLATLFP